MSIPNFNNLFQDSGPQGILDFLLSKIEANDLSPEEALAMLSAVHEEITETGGTDPKVFQTYNNFMIFLEREKPDLFEFVVANWKGRKETNPSSIRSEQNFDIDGMEAIDETPNTTEIKSDVGFNEVKETAGVAGEDDEAGEAGEDDDAQEPGKLEEKTNDQPGTTREGGDEIEPDGSSKEREDEDIDAKEEKTDDEAETNEGETEEVIDETETKEPEEAEEDQSESEENASDNEPEIEANEEPEEPRNESEKGGAEADSEGGQEESEWPEMEQSESGEIHDGVEEESETPPGEE